MKTHLLLPGVNLDTVSVRPEYREWLKTWLHGLEDAVADGSIAASLCAQGALAELVLYSGLRTDWLGIFEDLLTDAHGNPLAYSAAYGKKLYRFESQWQQTDVHAIHAQFWVARLVAGTPPQLGQWATLIESFIQPNGWMYNPMVSPTHLQTRMKSEYFMSMTMGVELLQAAGRLARHSASFLSTLVSTPRTDYLSSEHFRLQALELLGAPQHAPERLSEVLTSCVAGEGYCDFSVAGKIDDYMGTAKRTTRDVALHSPLSTLHARHLAHYVEEPIQTAVAARVQSLYDHLLAHPFDIRSFTIRDMLAPFGTDYTPVELIAAAALQ